MSFDGISNVEAGYHRRQRKSIVVSLVLLAIALVLAAVMMLYGNTIYTPSEVWDALKEVEGSAVFTVKTLRLPRMLTAILAGFAFGSAMISSFLMKGETSVQERLSSFHNSLCFSSSFLVSSCSG